MDQMNIISQPTELSQPWLLEDLEVAAFAKGEDLAKKVKETFNLGLGDRPYAQSVKKLYETSERKLPPKFAALKGETYIVTHAIGMVAKQSAANDITILGYKASIDGAGATVDLFPNTRVRDFISADLKFNAGVAADGSAKTPELLGNLAKDVINLGAGAELHLGTEANLVGNLTLSVKTPVIQAVGQASSTVTWQFDKADNPLVGDQVMIQTVLVPKGQETLKLNIQGFAVFYYGLLNQLLARPIRLETKPLTVEIELK